LLLIFALFAVGQLSCCCWLTAGGDACQESTINRFGGLRMRLRAVMAVLSGITNLPVWWVADEGVAPRFIVVFVASALQKFHRHNKYFAVIMAINGHDHQQKSHTRGGECVLVPIVVVLCVATT
jgi:hypothetical protein